MKAPIIIIPDVHGREFWRKALATWKDNETVIFLGDYLDPYENEWIYWSDAYKGLLDIIALKRENPDRVFLLLGNHDLHYMYSALKGSRFNEYQEDKIRMTFENNIDCFQMATECEIAQRRFLFTHAGLNRVWVEKYSDIFGPVKQITADTFNQQMFKDEFITALADVSSWRGGSDKAGSMIWADVDELEWEGARMPDVTQVFGHTIQAKGPKVFEDSIYCLDCKKAFVLNESAQIIEL